MVKSPLGILFFPFSNHSSTFTVSRKVKKMFFLCQIIGVSSRFVGCICVFCHFLSITKNILKMGVHHKNRVTWENQP